ncbi:MAG: hydroxysqualene dehydroxylase HpnE, partial [Gammaproteobacteria bacterium]
MPDCLPPLKKGGRGGFKPTTLIVGGGWAGLAAALELCRHGWPVTLLEAAPQLGGRARAVSFDELRVDNGQHLMIGAYRDLLSLLQTLGIREQDAFQRLPLKLQMRSPQGSGLKLELPALPAPLHLLLGLLRCRGLSGKERRQALRLCLAMAGTGAHQKDEPLLSYLMRHRQSAALRHKLWEPLCLAMLNTPLEMASSAVFRTVLQTIFSRRRRHADLLIPRGDLDTILPAPAQAFMAAHGATVQLRQRVTALSVVQGRIHGVVTADGHHHAAAQLILTLPPAACQQLLAPHAALAALSDRLARLRYAPICTVYLRYPPAVRLEQPMAGLLDTTGQWLFDRGYSGQPGMMAVVISGPGPHMTLDKQELATRIGEELAALFPHWPPPLATRVIREKQATFLCHSGVQRLRPGSATP